MGAVVLLSTTGHARSGYCFGGSVMRPIDWLWSVGCGGDNGIQVGVTNQRDDLVVVALVSKIFYLEYPRQPLLAHQAFEPGVADRECQDLHRMAFTLPLDRACGLLPRRDSIHRARIRPGSKVSPSMSGVGLIFRPSRRYR